MSDPTAPTALLPCPFCGATRIAVLGPPLTTNFIVCCSATGCPANPSVKGVTQKGAYLSWNTRHKEPHHE